MKMTHLALLFCSFSLLGLHTVSAQGSKPQVLLRLDDCGMNHSVNMAIEEVAKTGIPFSTSVMFVCPWYQEAVAILKRYPHVSVGVHLTLTAEWRYYRWGPILGRSAVPSLVDSLGYFLPSNADFLKNDFKLDEVEKELSAQIERGLNSGLKIDYIDHHMETAVATPGLRAVFEKLAHKYHLGMSWYFGEDKFKTTSKKTTADIFNHLKNLKSDRINLVVFHIARADPEMNALVSLHQEAQGETIIAERRSALLSLLIGKEFTDLVNQKQFDIITYSDVVRTAGLENMHPPALNRRQMDQEKK
jgi:chitin disaccharide deacetylase